MHAGTVAILSTLLELAWAQPVSLEIQQQLHPVCVCVGLFCFTMGHVHKNTFR